MSTIIAIHPSGFEVRFEVELTEINEMIRKLEKRHYRPNRELAYTAEGLPICPRHGVPMSKREKQGDTWYSHKITDPETGQEVYCRGYASPSSPGYDIEVNTHEPNHRAGYQKKEVERNGRAARTKPKNEIDVEALNDMLFG